MVDGFEIEYFHQQHELQTKLETSACQNFNMNMNHLEIFVKTWILMYQVSGGAGESVFLTSFQELPMLLAHTPHCELQACVASKRYLG